MNRKKSANKPITKSKEKPTSKTMNCMSGLALFFVLAFILLLYEPKKTFTMDAPRFVCIANDGQYYWNSVHQGILDGDEAMGCYTKWIEFPRYDTEEQLRQLEKLDYLHIDGLITLGEPFSSEVTEKIQEIRGRGIPVVLIDTDDRESGRDCYIGTDNQQAGEMAAKALAEKMEGQAECAVILSKKIYANQTERLEGFLHELKNYQGMCCVAIIEAEGDKLTLQDQLEQTFNQYPSINALFCAEAASTRRLWPILPAKKQTGLSIIGFDNADATLEFIRQGYYTGTIVQDPYAIGYHAVEALSSILQGNTPDEIHTPIIYLTAEALEEEP